MVNEIEPGIFQVSVNIDGEWWTDEYIVLWMQELKRNHQSALNSRRVYANALNIFLHYYIYNPQNKNQSLYDYLLNFRVALRDGITISIKRTVATSRLVIEKEYRVMSTKPFAVSTVNTYMTGIQWYLFYLKEAGVESVDSLFKNEIDWKQLQQRALRGKGGGYGLMMGPLLAQLLGPKKKLIRNLKIDRPASGLDTFFPPEIFSELLEISEPREQAIYLLCGCAGSRIGQALSLTRDDYNFETNEVYIVDPLSDEKGPSGRIGRSRLLKEEYGINMEHGVYKYLACKYPIPLQYSELLWIDLHSKQLFFRALANVSKGNPVTNGHPFIFNTSNGKILTPNEAYRTFRRKIEILIERKTNEWKSKRNAMNIDQRYEVDEEYNYIIGQLKKVKGLHSLRHMYGVLWADYAAIHDEVNLQDMQLLCQYGMGHTSSGSVMAYFTLRSKSRHLIIKRLASSSSTIEEYLARAIKEVRKYSRRNI